MNFKADIGEGWFGHVQLGSAGFGYWTGKFGDPSASFQAKPSSSSVEGANRGDVDFMLIYFGRKTKEFGYMGGLIPVNGLKILCWIFIIIHTRWLMFHSSCTATTEHMVSPVILE